MEGLLHSELYNYAWDLLSNMMDFIEVSGRPPGSDLVKLISNEGVRLHSQWWKVCLAPREGAIRADRYLGNTT